MIDARRPSTLTSPSCATRSRAAPTTTSSTGRPATPRPIEPPSPAPTCTVSPRHALPAIPPGTDGDLRVGGLDGPGHRQADGLHHQPSPARPPHRVCARRRHPRAQDPGDLPGPRRRLGNKVPIYPGYVLAVVGSIVTKRPVKWIEDRTSNLMTTGFARDYHMHGEIAASRDGNILAVQVNVLADHGAFNATAQPTSSRPVLPHLHRLLRLRRRPLQGDRRVHQQGAGRRGCTPARSASPRRCTWSSDSSSACPTSWASTPPNCGCATC